MTSLSNKEVKEMIEKKIVSADIICHFHHIYKGQYTFTFEHDGKPYHVRNGEASHEAAYYLELKATMPLGHFAESTDEW
jgi:hypothetical protein